MLMQKVRDRINLCCLGLVTTHSAISALSLHCILLFRGENVSSMSPSFVVSRHSSSPTPLSTSGSPPPSSASVASPHSFYDRTYCAPPLAPPRSQHHYILQAFLWGTENEENEEGERVENGRKEKEDADTNLHVGAVTAEVEEGNTQQPDPPVPCAAHLQVGFTSSVRQESEGTQPHNGNECMMQDTAVCRARRIRLFCSEASRRREPAASGRIIHRDTCHREREARTHSMYRAVEENLVPPGCFDRIHNIRETVHVNRENIDKCEEHQKPYENSEINSPVCLRDASRVCRVSSPQYRTDEEGKDLQPKKQREGTEREQAPRVEMPGEISPREEDDSQKTTDFHHGKPRHSLVCYEAEVRQEENNSLRELGKTPHTPPGSLFDLATGARGLKGAAPRVQKKGLVRDKSELTWRKRCSEMIDFCERNLETAKEAAWRVGASLQLTRLFRNKPTIEWLRRLGNESLEIQRELMLRYGNLVEDMLQVIAYTVPVEEQGDLERDGFQATGDTKRTRHVLLLLQATLQLFTLYRYYVLHPGARAPHNIVCDILFSQLTCDDSRSSGSIEDKECSVSQKTLRATFSPLYPTCASSQSFPCCPSSSGALEQYLPSSPLTQTSTVVQQRIQRLVVEGCTFGLRGLRALQSLLEIHFFQVQGRDELYVTKRFSVCLWIEVIKAVLKVYLHSASRLQVYVDDETICQVFETKAFQPEERVSGLPSIHDRWRGPPTPNMRDPSSRYPAASTARRTRRHVPRLRSSRSVEAAKLQRTDCHPHSAEHEVSLRSCSSTKMPGEMKMLEESFGRFPIQDRDCLGTGGHQDFLLRTELGRWPRIKLSGWTSDRSTLKRRIIQTPFFPLFLVTVLRVASTAARLGAREVVDEWRKREAARVQEGEDEKRGERHVYTKPNGGQKRSIVTSGRNSKEEGRTAEREEERKRTTDSLMLQFTFLRLLARQKKHLLMGEFLYHFRPILHLILLRRAFRQPERRWRGMAGTSLFEGLWLPWVVALVMDILSYNLVQKGLVQEWGEPQCERGATASRHPVDERGYPLSTAENFEQAELQNRRKCIYLAALRSPFFDKFLLRPSERLAKLLKSIPFVRNLNTVEAFLVYRHLYFTTSGT